MLASHCASAAAQTTEAWPTKPVTLIAPFTPGGTTDLVARALATQLQTLWSQPVIVDNKPGAGTAGAALTARAPADGYTLLLANVGHTAAACGLYKNLPYEFTTHLESITSVAQVPNVLLVPKSLPVANVGELIKGDEADRKGAVSYGSAGIGSTQHLSAELLKSLAKVEATHIPYKGAAPMMI